MQRFLPNRAQFFGFITAFIVLNVIGATVQTQFNLGHLLALGIDVPFSTRISTTLHDIVSLQPLFGVIFGIGFLIAMIVGHFIAKLVKILPDMAFALAGFAAMAVTLLSMKAVFQITAIGAAREWEGFLSLCVVGALAGYAFSVAKTRFARSA
ncbi:MAG: hypothetical protein ACPGJJ_02700 [Parvibaculales bacterium]|jgi:hypothetical protein